MNENIKNKKIITKKYRNEVYRLMLDMIETDVTTRISTCWELSRCRGFCSYLASAVNKTDYDEYTKIANKDIERWSYINNIKLYPELIKYKPDHYYDYWFERDDDGANKRIAMLEQAIKETSIKISK